MKHKLDPEEDELLNMFEKGDLKRSRQSKTEIATAKEAATQHMKKEARINIRLSQFDLDRLKRIASNEGLPYQSLISSILHKYVTRAMP